MQKTFKDLSRILPQGTSGFTEELKNIIQIITERINVEKIFLFGSYASGNSDNKSDIDLCILTDDRRRKIIVIRDLQESIYNIAQHSVDILVYSPEEFLDRADSVSTIEKDIQNRGLVVYE